jgi:hypothetical protein
MLEIRGASPGLLDDPLLLDVGGAPPNAALTWRARLRDDDGFVWRAQAATPAGLLTAWTPAKASAGGVAALRSLRPIDVDVRVEDPDGDASSRTITRSLLADGVKVRRWRKGVTGSLYLPVEPATAALILDATDPPATSRDDSTTHTVVESSLDAPGPVAALLASRGVLVFVVTGGGAGAARDLVGALPNPPEVIAQRAAADVPLAPGVPARGAESDPAAWDALLATLGARPRRVAR